MFSDIEGCQKWNLAGPNKGTFEQSGFLCNPAFYEEMRTRLGSDPYLNIAFLGDYFDQGMGVYESIKGLDMLLSNFNKEGKERVFVILGNRDVNKLRFCYELAKKDEVVGIPNGQPRWSLWDKFHDGLKSKKENEVALVNHILFESMGAKIDMDSNSVNGAPEAKLIGLHSFIPPGKNINDSQLALKYLKVSLGIIPKDATTDDALDLLGFFHKCKLARVFDGTHGKVLLSHAGGFDPEAFFNKAYVDSFGVGMPEVIDPSVYHSTLENFRQKLSGTKSSQTGGQPKLQIIGNGIVPGNVSVKSSREKGLAYSKQLKPKSRKLQNDVSVLESVPVLKSVPVLESDPVLVESVSVSESVPAPESATVLKSVPVLESDPAPESATALESDPVLVESVSVSESVNAYNDLLRDVLDEVSKKKFTWKFVLLQALGLKPDIDPNDNDARYKSLIQSCSQNGCKGPNLPLSNDPGSLKLAKILKDSGITHVSYGHYPICFPIPVIYKRQGIEGVTFISNDTSNGNRKIDEVGESTAIGTMVIFDPNGVTTQIEPVELNGREAKVRDYSEMYKPLTYETTPLYEPDKTGAYVLKYGNGTVGFNNITKTFDQLRYTGPSPAGGKRRSRHRKQHKSKRGSKHGGSKKTMHRRRKHTKRARKARKY